MQDQMANIEIRLEELRKPININDNSDDGRSAPGGSGGRGRGDDGTPPRPPGRDEFNKLTRRLNRLCCNLLYLHLECRVDCAFLYQM